jgi:Ca2+-dependent lipid-binding protein
MIDDFQLESYSSFTSKVWIADWTVGSGSVRIVTVRVTANNRANIIKTNFII